MQTEKLSLGTKIFYRQFGGHIFVHIFALYVEVGVAKRIPKKTRQEKRTQTQIFGPDIFGWGGGLPREGVRAKKFSMSLETRETKLFWRDRPGFGRDIPGAREKFEKKTFVFNFRSLNKLPVQF